VISNRQMRRMARRARRAGLQPVVVLGDGGRLPPSAAEVIARVAWGYRSELAPFLVAGAVFLAGWWAHLSTPHWYPVFIAGSAAVSWLLVTFGAWLGLPWLPDRVYAGLTVFSAGGWVAFAALFGPLTPPLLLALGAVALILAVPWWADRRRRARARVLRVVAAWPDIALAIGLPGSVIQSVSVDVWGWRAWLRLANGQTVADVTARIPAIESGLGTVHGAVYVFPARDGKANWCEIHVLGSGTHAAT
jgi:S-DNA-T family DNA segregation ATPase FtsK/SpoIIIE